jgi:hypothetical protein
VSRLSRTATCPAARASVAPGTDRIARPEPAAQIDEPSNGRFGVCARGLPLQRRPELASVAQKRHQCRHFYLPVRELRRTRTSRPEPRFLPAKRAMSPTRGRERSGYPATQTNALTMAESWAARARREEVGPGLATDDLPIPGSSDRRGSTCPNLRDAQSGAQ